MADDADRADREVERTLKEALRKLRHAGPVANGRCHYCDEIVGDTMRWCGVECAREWEREFERRRR